MTFAKILAVFSLVCLVLAAAYWIRHAYRQAQRERKVFAPRPQSPSRSDQQSLLDRNIETEWRRRVEENEARRASRQQVSFLLKRQAG